MVNAIILSLSEEERIFFLDTTIDDPNWQPDFRVVEYDEKLRRGGLIELTCIDFQNPHLGCISIALTPNARGSGLSDMLFDKICEVARKEGFTQLEWNPIKENVKSIRLAQRLGFKETKKRGRQKYRYFNLDL